MNLETIQSMWEKDSQIDQIKIHDEAAKIPSLHAKYWDVYNTLKLLREKAKRFKFCFSRRIEFPCKVVLASAVHILKLERYRED